MGLFVHDLEGVRSRGVLNAESTITGLPAKCPKLGKVSCIQ